MATIPCPSCGKRVSNKAVSCTNCGEPIKKKTPIFSWAILILLIFYFVGTITEDGSQNTGITASASSHITKTIEKKWIDNLEYAYLKNKSNQRVVCKSKRIQSKSYILCTYYVGDYHRKALFFVEGERLVAVNGTARQLSHYSDIRDYSYDKDGKIDITSIVDSF